MGKTGRYDSDKENLEGHELLTWTDDLRSRFHNDAEKVSETGAVVRPRREFLKQQIAVRQKEAAEEQKRQAAEMKAKLKRDAE